VHLAAGWRHVPEALEKRAPALPREAATYPAQLPLVASAAAPAGAAAAASPSATKTASTAPSAHDLRVGLDAFKPTASAREMKRR
jgi:hypothetical protein